MFVTQISDPAFSYDNLSPCHLPRYEVELWGSKLAQNLSVVC